MRFSMQPHDYSMNLQAIIKKKLQFLLPVVFTISPDVNHRSANSKAGAYNHHDGSAEEGNDVCTTGGAKTAAMRLLTNPTNRFSKCSQGIVPWYGAPSRPMGARTRCESTCQASLSSTYESSGRTKGIPKPVGQEVILSQPVPLVV